jgi:hypothetical protein
MIYHWCVTRVTRLVAHVEQELLTVPEYIEVIHVLELGSCVSKTQNTMAKRQNTYRGTPQLMRDKYDILFRVGRPTTKHNEQLMNMTLCIQSHPADV